MHQRILILSIIATAAFWTTGAAGQQRPIEADLAKLASGRGLHVTVTNRTVSGFTDGARRGLRLSEGPGEGPAYLEGVEFGNGTIELDIRGKDVQGQSFVGVAFHGVDSTTYDAIYFRPFNFRAADSTRHAHAVQYVSQPTHPWQKLRAEHPGMYENAVNPALEPNGWFHARVVVTGSEVRVFVDRATIPSLVVTRLSERSKGLVGLWVGNGSGGDFANLTIRPE
jgi:hypothetical protein